MSREDLVENLGTIARSGTGRFLEQLSGEQDHDLKLIGQFGVGFYSVFMVADRVVVQTRKAGEEQGWLWGSDGRSGYTVQEAAGPLPRGTSVTLHLKADAKEFLDSWKIREIVRTYSDHIGIPIIFEHRPKAGDTKTNLGEPQQINEASAIWTRPKAEITDEQYKEFYHHVAHAFDEPFARVHFAAEGTLSYTALLFVPSHAPVRPARPQAPPRREALRPSGVHHLGPGSADAALPALRLGRGRLRGPAAQCQPRDPAARCGDRQDAQGPGPAPAGRAGGEGQARGRRRRSAQDRELRQVVGAVRRGSEGRPLRGRRQSAQAAGARPLPQHARPGLDQPRRLCGTDEGRPGGDLLHQRREPHRPAHQPAARAGAGQGRRGAAARRPGRRVLAAGGQELPEPRSALTDPRRGRPV